MPRERQLAIIRVTNDLVLENHFINSTVIKHLVFNFKKLVKIEHKPKSNACDMVYVASMNMRGKWAPLPHENCQRVNVTSAQSKSSKFRLAFSPMTPIEGGYRGYLCFENYWQAGKRFEGQTEEEVEEMIRWWKDQDKGRRRYKGSKGRRVSHAEFDGVAYDYVESRKRVYVPHYAALVKEYIDSLFGGQEKELVVYDFDGPRDENGGVMCEEVTVELLKHKIQDTRFPFGHGYIVGGLLAGIEPVEYV